MIFQNLKPRTEKIQRTKSEKLNLKRIKLTNNKNDKIAKYLTPKKPNHNQNTNYEK